MAGPFGWRTPPGSGSGGDGQTTRAALQGVLAQLRAAYQRTPVVAGLWQVDGEPPRRSAMFRPRRPCGCAGRCPRRGGRAVPVDVQLGGRQPRARVFTVPGAARPKVRLRVELVPPLEILPTAAELARARDPLLALQAGLGSVATSWWYAHYLGSPDAIGRSSAVYAYRTVRVAAAPAAPSSSGGGDTLAIVLGDRARRGRSGRARGALGALVDRCNRQSIFASVEDARRARGRRRCRRHGGSRGAVASSAAPKLPAADRAAIDRTLDVFVPAAIGRVHSERAWPLTTASMQRGATLADWRQGLLPVQPFPVIGKTFHGWTVDRVGRNRADVVLLAHLRKGNDLGLGAASFDLTMRKLQRPLARRRGRRRGHVRRPRQDPRRERLRRGQQPGPVLQGIGGLHSGLPTGLIYAIPAVLLGLVMLVPLGILVLHRRRERMPVSDARRERVFRTSE